MSQVISTEPAHENNRVYRQKDVLLDEISFYSWICHKEWSCTRKVIVPGSVSVHMVLKIMVTKPAVIRKANQIQRK